MYTQIPDPNWNQNIVLIFIYIQSRHNQERRQRSGLRHTPKQTKGAGIDHSIPNGVIPGLPTSSNLNE